MKSWRQEISLRLREAVLRHYLVPYSRVGLDAGLVPHLQRRSPVTLIDVGANRGDFAAAVQRHCGLKRALLIEPQQARCAELSARFAGAPVEVACCALLDAPGARELRVLAADSCSSLLTVKPAEGFAAREIDVNVTDRVSVPVETLDAVVTRARWSEPIDVLKIDTQGTELQVLAGAARTLASVRLLWIEVSFKSLYEGDALFAQVHEHLAQRHFRLYSLHDVFRAADGELLQADALFLGPSAVAPTR